MIKKFEILKVFLVILVSPFLLRLLDIDWKITVILLLLWVLVYKFKNNKYWLILIFFILVLINLYINRLLNFDIYTKKISFDFEQSFFRYPGIRESIIRYKQEGLWLPYFLRNIFYSYYLIIFSWVSLILKTLSPINWIKMIGFSGFAGIVAGIIHYFKSKNKNYFMIWWFLLVIISSSLRVLGDSVTAIYMTLPVVFYWLFLGFKSKFFEKYYIYWYGLFLIDILLK